MEKQGKRFCPFSAQPRGLPYRLPCRLCILIQWVRPHKEVLDCHSSVPLLRTCTVLLLDVSDHMRPPTPSIELGSALCCTYANACILLLSISHNTHICGFPFVWCGRKWDHLAPGVWPLPHRCHSTSFLMLILE